MVHNIIEEFGSNHPAPFKINYGTYTLSYNTVTHMIIAHRLTTVVEYSDIAYQFTLESGSDISKMHGYLANKCFRKLEGYGYIEKIPTINDDWGNIAKEIKFIANLEKIKQNPKYIDYLFKNDDLHQLKYFGFDIISDMLKAESNGYKVLGYSTNLNITNIRKTNNYRHLIYLDENGFLRDPRNPNIRNLVVYTGYINNTKCIFSRNP